MRLHLCFIGALSLTSVSCVSIDQRPTTATKPNAQQPAVTMSQLLQLPIHQGHYGVDKVIGLIRLWYDLPPDAPITKAGTREPVVLANGTRLSELWTVSAPGYDWGRLSGRISLSPCYSVDEAISLTGAVKASDSIHGDVYDAYEFSNSEVLIYFSSPSVGGRCVGYFNLIKNYRNKSP